jgi:hypothetical protein
MLSPQDSVAKLAKSAALIPKAIKLPRRSYDNLSLWNLDWQKACTRPSHQFACFNELLNRAPFEIYA